MTTEAGKSMSRDQACSGDQIGCVNQPKLDDAPLKEREDFEDFEEKLSHLAKIETSLLKTMATSNYFTSLSNSIRRQHKVASIDFPALESTAVRERFLAKLRFTGEVNHLIQVTVSYLQRSLSSDPIEETQAETDRLSFQRSSLEAYLVKFHEEDLQNCEKISKALKNPRWDFRTVQGIAKEAGLEDCKVEELLQENPNLFRKLPVTDKTGRNLFTLASHPIRWKERLAVLQSALKGNYQAT